MKLGSLLQGVTVTKLFQTMFGRMVVTHEVEVNAIRTDSRKVTRGDLFVAIKGSTFDGHTRILDALQQGAKAIVLEHDDILSDANFMHAGAVKIVVPDSRKALANLAANASGRPADKLRIVGVTGTNGKTTTTHIIRSILEAGGERSGMIGTIDVRYADVVLPASHTTPDPVELHKLFQDMVQARCTAVSMEVSSHALDQSRVEAIPFRCAVFSNLTQDHLDYHGTMAAYADAKKKLFDGLTADATAVMNCDDPAWPTMIRDTRARVITYGTSADADVRLLNAGVSVSGCQLTIGYDGSEVALFSPLLGRFNVSNVLAGFAAGVALDIRVPAIELGIASLTNVKGRFERVSSKRGWTAIIDYAHTPDALDKLLRTVREMVPAGSGSRVITVFGAGGDRDRTKRPKMGAIAAQLSDVVIVTSDNPRSESPDVIIEEIVAGIARKQGVERDVDRRKAIARAAALAEKGDIIVVAGKGHEEVQVIGSDRSHFSDREEVEKIA